ncbi:MAG TPA: hypothetical protein VF614_15200 [Chthoniobacteraceae bacterium]|jgi:hypothetical protein
MHRTQGDDPWLPAGVKTQTARKQILPEFSRRLSSEPADAADRREM